MKITRINPEAGDVLGSEEETTLGIDAENMGMAIQQLTSYQQPIASLVREVVSNALDSHLEAESYSKLTWDAIIDSGWTDHLADKTNIVETDDAGNDIFLEKNPLARVQYALEMEETFADWKTSPVRVELIPSDKMTEEPGRFRVTDFGVGISPYRMKKIYAKFFSSTKRGTNRQIGAFGLGAKAPLGYTDSFLIITRWQKVEYTYTIYMGDRGPAIRPLGEEATTEANGTTIEITLVDADKDHEVFLKAIREQLAYFDNVEFIGVNVPAGKIIQGKNFLYRENSPFSGLHIVLGKVYYPIDFSAMGLSSYEWKSPLGIYIPMECVDMHEHEGKVSIMHTRESLKYNPETVKVIRERFEAARAEITALYEATAKAVSSMEEYWDLVQGKKKAEVELAPGVFLMNADSFIKIKPTYPKYDFLKKLPYNIFFEWHSLKRINMGKVMSGRYRVQQPEAMFRDGSTGYTMDKDTAISIRKNKYIYWQGVQNFTLIKKKYSKDLDILAEFGYDDYSKDHIPSADQRIGVQAFMDEVDAMVRSSFLPYENEVPTDEFRDEERELRAEKATGNTKTGRRRKRGSDQFPIRILKWTGYEWSWDMSYMTEEQADDDRKGLTVYGTIEEDELLKGVAPAFFKNTEFHKYAGDDVLCYDRVRIIKVARNSRSYFSDNPKAIDIRDFINMNHKIVMRHMTAYLIIQRTAQQLVTLIDPLVSEVAPQLHKSAVFLQAYVNTYYLGASSIPGLTEEFLMVFKNKERERLLEEKAWQKDVVRAKRAGIRPRPRPTTAPMLDADAMWHMRRLSAMVKAFPLISAIDFSKVDRVALRSYFQLHGRATPDLVARLVNRK